MHGCTHACTVSHADSRTDGNAIADANSRSNRDSVGCADVIAINVADVRTVVHTDSRTNGDADVFWQLHAS
jgi:hypothetical protein